MNQGRTNINWVISILIKSFTYELVVCRHWSHDRVGGGGAIVTGYLLASYPTLTELSDTDSF